jgi:ribosomal protein S27AE
MGDEDGGASATTPEPAATGTAGPEGGESVCWLERVCPECGRLADTAPPVRCTRCGTLLTG